MNVVSPQALSGAETAVRQAVAGMLPGWVVLRGCMLDLDGTRHAARVQYALLHADVGIALLDILPGPTATDAAMRLSRRLGAANFGKKFDRLPPIRYLCVPRQAISGLGPLLEQAFSSQPSSPPRGGAWVAAAQTLLTSHPLNDLSHPAASNDEGAQLQPRAVRQGQRPAEARRPARLLRNARWLGVFWGAAAVSVGGGLLFLQYLGPPPGRAVGAAGPELESGAGLQSKERSRPKNAGPSSIAAPASRAAAETVARAPANDAVRTPSDVDEDQSPLEVELRRAMMENEQAIQELERQLNRGKRAVGAGLDAPAAIADRSLDSSPAAALADPWRMPVSGTVGAASISPVSPIAGRDLVPGPAATTPTPASAIAPAHPAPEPGIGVDARPVASPAASPAGSFAEIMIRRADAALQRGDVSGARLLYERAAAAGSSQAATAMARTFDAAPLAELGVTGMSADPALAATWYRRALSLRDAEARNRPQAVPIMATGATQDKQP